MWENISNSDQSALPLAEQGRGSVRYIYRIFRTSLNLGHLRKTCGGINFGADLCQASSFFHTRSAECRTFLGPAVRLNGKRRERENEKEVINIYYVKIVLWSKVWYAVCGTCNVDLTFLCHFIRLPQHRVRHGFINPVVEIEKNNNSRAITVTCELLMPSSCDKKTLHLHFQHVSVWHLQLKNNS